MKEKFTQIINKIKEKLLPVWDKCKEHISPSVLALSIFVILFILDLFALNIWTNTGLVIACILLVIEVVLAVLLSDTNYGILGAVALAEVVVGLITKNFVTTLLSLIVYFLALVVIHVMRTHGGKKA